MSAAAVASASPDSGQSAHLREGLKALLILAAFALVTRGWIFGNPVVNMDEQFYLFVGERMWQGGLPYVDIWDRKPVGLFLITHPYNKTHNNYNSYKRAYQSPSGNAPAPQSVQYPLPILEFPLDRHLLR